MTKKNQHVIPHDGDWAVKGAGNEKITKTFEKKTDAIDYAKVIAKNQQSELIIHKGDGTIQNKNSFGNDPNPPKDMKPQKKNAIQHGISTSGYDVFIEDISD